MYLFICMALAWAMSATDSTASLAADDCSAGVSTCGAEQILLQKTQTRLASAANHFEQQSKSLADAPSMKASQVPLSEEGYKMIAKLKNEREMAFFVKRVADELGYEIVDEGSLNGVVPYYSGKKAIQSFVALTAELSRTSKKQKGWARKISLEKSSLPALKDSQQILLQESRGVVFNRPRTSLMESGKMTAEEVPLSEEGYKTIVELKDDHEMAHFITRVAEEHGYEIAHAGSLSGVVPYYSGKKATQSFVALAAELGRTSKKGNGWAKKAGKKTHDKKPPNTAMIEKKDESKGEVTAARSGAPKQGSAEASATKAQKKKKAAKN
jgi:hypothetical protein